MTKLILIYGAVAALAIFNGILSPHSFTVFALQGIWYPSIFPMSLKLMFILSGFISGMLHFLATGIPVAILEKALPQQRITSGLVWLAVMLIPTSQTLRHFGWF